MVKKYVAAIDQGTTSTRFMIFDHAGKVVANAQKEHRQIFPKPGWVEHDPIEIWERTTEVITAGLHNGGISVDEIAALGITNQRETAVIWDKNTGKPVYNAIVWQDTRTDEICKRLEGDEGQDRFRAKTGLPLATYFAGPKLMWGLENIEGVRDQASKGNLLFGTVDSWLIWNLTGGVNGGIHLTDVTNASRTLLMNLETLDWDKELIQIMNIPRSMLPEIRPSSEIYGHATGTLEGIPIAGCLGDQQAALFGQACYETGDAKNTYGTGCFLLLNTGTTLVHSQNGLLTTMGYKIGTEPPVYALEGSVAITGALVQWLRDNLEIIKDSADVEPLAETVDDNGGIYFVPAFSGLYAPYWKSSARGVIAGMTRYVTKAHFARAALEATAYQTREVLEAMNEDAGVNLKSLKVDGGMVVNELLMQFQADILDVPVTRPVINETTALGSAYAAGLAVGFWENLEDLRKNWQEDKSWSPKMDNEKRSILYSGWKKAVTRTFDWTD